MNHTLPIDARAADRLSAQSQWRLERMFEAVTANLANVETPGYKRLQSPGETFALLLSQEESRSVSLEPAPPVRDFRQGVLQATGNNLDLALDGKGFLAVEKHGQPAFVRTASLRLDQDGYLTDQRGALLLTESGPVRIEGSLQQLQIREDGTVLLGKNELGRLRTVDFKEPRSLSDLGGGMYGAPANLPTAAASVKVLTGQRERSNVDPLQEMVSLIAIQRQHQATQRALTTRSELRQRLSQTLSS